MPSRDEHAGFFPRQLCLHPAGDAPQHSRGRLAPAELDLVQEGAAEIAAADLGQAHATVLTEATDALAERLDSRHPGIIRRCKAGVYIGGAVVLGTSALRRRRSLRATWSASRRK